MKIRYRKIRYRKMSNKCKYIIKRGANKGSQCGRNCRTDYCFDHKPKRLNKRREDIKEKYYKEKKEKIIKETIDTVKIEEIDELKLALKIKSLQDELTLITRKYHGILTYLNPDHRIPIRKSIKDKIESENFKIYAEESYLELEKSTRETFGSLNNYIKYLKEKELTYPNTYIKIIQYTGTKKEAKIKLIKLEMKYIKTLKTIKILQEYLNNLKN